MGDTPAPSAKPKDTTRSSSPALPPSQTKVTHALSTAPPTDDIDSEWPTDDAPAESLVAESAPRAQVLLGADVSTPDSAGEAVWHPADDTASALVAPTFPSDPGVPRDLPSPSVMPSSRPLAPSDEAVQSRRDMDTVPAAPQASRPPNSSGASSSRRRSNPSEVEASLVASRTSDAPREVTSPTDSAVASAASGFESSSANVVALPPAPGSTAARQESNFEARHSFDPHVHPSEPAQAKRPSRTPLVFALVASIAAGFFLMRGVGSSSAPATKATTAALQTDTPHEKLEARAAAVAPPPSDNRAAQAPVNPEPASPETPAESAAPRAEDAPAPSGGNVSVVIRVRPPQARIFYRGKEVGKAPVTVEIEPGKRRAYEVSLPGFMTRRVVVDGSATELSVGLRPDPSAPAAK